MRRISRSQARRYALAAQGFSAASNGFSGFSPLAGGKWDRGNFAAYVDMEADIVEDWLVGVALRWEDFEDFGAQPSQ